MKGVVQTGTEIYEKTAFRQWEENLYEICKKKKYSNESLCQPKSFNIWLFYWKKSLEGC